MKTELNLENKAKFFAQYWGQKVIKYVNNYGEMCTYPVHQSNMYRFEESHLELTPLSDITDKDATEDTMSLYSGNVDKLRSKGYALPWMGLSVEDMIQAGWIKLKVGK